MRTAWITRLAFSGIAWAPEVTCRRLGDALFTWQVFMGIPSTDQPKHAEATALVVAGTVERALELGLTEVLGRFLKNGIANPLLVSSETREVDA